MTVIWGGSLGIKFRNQNMGDFGGFLGFFARAKRISLLTIRLGCITLPKGR
jgi:hypothetical protein